MNKSKIDFFQKTHKDFFKKDDFVTVLDELSQLQDDAFSEVNLLKYRNPNNMLSISFLFGLFGIDRFIIGQPLVGFLKLISFGGGGIWWILDFCSIMPRIKKSNFKLFRNKIKDLTPNSALPFIEQKKEIDNIKPMENNIVNDLESIIVSCTTRTMIHNDSSVIDVSNDESALDITDDDSMINISNDESALDITDDEIDLSINGHADTDGNSVPYWEHEYIWSYHDIDTATQIQKDFYCFFKKNFLHGKDIDINDNSNYAFVLMFDLLSKFSNHQDISLIEQQLIRLGSICSRTKHYGLQELLKTLKQKKSPEYIERYKYLNDPGNQYQDGWLENDPYMYLLGKQYQKKLDLNKQEVAWLNKFEYSWNVFLDIEKAKIAVIQQYTLALKHLNNYLKTKQTTLTKELKYFQEIIDNRNALHTENMYDIDNTWERERVQSEFYLTIFKRVENSVRTVYGHKRKVAENFLPCNDLNTNLNDEYEKRIGCQLSEIISDLVDKITLPDMETQILLNTLNVNRWKDEFSNIKAVLHEEKINEFVDSINHLEEINVNNPNIENIFFEATNIIAQYDKVLALKFYAKYIYYDIQSPKINNKPLSKTLQKNLFADSAVEDAYCLIVMDLIKNKDYHKAESAISEIYTPKRKQISLDMEKIIDVKNSYFNTVELLNGYLDSSEPESLVVSEEAIIENQQDDTDTIPLINSMFMPTLSFDFIEIELVKTISDNSFKMTYEAMNHFANQNNVLKNQVIDSINGKCSDILEDNVLIEEEDEFYVIDESFYKEILK